MVNKWIKEHKNGETKEDKSETSEQSQDDQEVKMDVEAKETMFDSELNVIKDESILVDDDTIEVINAEDEVQTDSSVKIRKRLKLSMRRRNRSNKLRELETFYSFDKGFEINSLETEREAYGAPNKELRNIQSYCFNC